MALVDAYCQMPVSYDETKLPKSFAVEQKLPGLRCVFVGDKFLTLGDKRVPVASEIIEAVSAVGRAFERPMILDGVLAISSIVVDPGDDTGKKVGIGIFHVFDAIPGTNLKDRRHTDAYFNRKAELKTIMLRRDVSKSGIKLLDAVPLSSTGSTHEQVIIAAKAIWAAGGLGVVIKNKDAFYKHGTSSSWMQLTKQHADVLENGHS